MQKLTDEERLLGLTEPREKTLTEKTALTDACRYELFREGTENISIESGRLVANILPSEQKQMLLNGESEIVYNGLVIRKITELVPAKEQEEEQKVEEPKEEKPVKKTVKKKAKNNG